MKSPKSRGDLVAGLVGLILAVGCATTAGGDGEEAGVRTRGLRPPSTQSLAVNPTLKTSLAPRVSDYLARPTLSERERLCAFVGWHADSGTSGIMATLFVIFRESIERTNEDKRYFLERLRAMNEVAAALGEYLKSLQALAGSLEDKDPDSSGCRGSEDAHVVSAVRRNDALQAAVARAKRGTRSTALLGDLDRLVRSLKRERAAILGLADLSKDLARRGLR